MSYPSTLLVLAILSFFIGAGALAQPVDPTLYGSLPTVSHAQISPDGNTIVQTQSDGDGQAIVFYDLTGEAAPVGSKFREGEVRSLIWADDDYALILLSASRRAAGGDRIETYEFFRWISVNRKTGNLHAFFAIAVDKIATSILANFTRDYKMNRDSP